MSSAVEIPLRIWSMVDPNRVRSLHPAMTGKNRRAVSRVPKEYRLAKRDARITSKHRSIVFS